MKKEKTFAVGLLLGRTTNPGCLGAIHGLVGRPAGRPLKLPFRKMDRSGSLSSFSVFPGLAQIAGRATLSKLASTWMPRRKRFVLEPHSHLWPELIRETKRPARTTTGPSRSLEPGRPTILPFSNTCLSIIILTHPGYCHGDFWSRDCGRNKRGLTTMRRKAAFGRRICHSLTKNDRWNMAAFFRRRLLQSVCQACYYYSRRFLFAISRHDVFRS
jgi:hypothetical protein